MTIFVSTFENVGLIVFLSASLACEDHAAQSGKAKSKKLLEGTTHHSEAMWIHWGKAIRMRRWRCTCRLVSSGCKSTTIEAASMFENPSLPRSRRRSTSTTNTALFSLMSGFAPTWEPSAWRLLGSECIYACNTDLGIPTHRENVCSAISGMSDRKAPVLLRQSSMARVRRPRLAPLLQLVRVSFRAGASIAGAAAAAGVGMTAMGDGESGSL